MDRRKEMKYRIANKLTVYFSITLLLFSILIGSVFMVLFRNHTIALQKSDLEKRSIAIAATLSEFMSSGSSNATMGNGKQGGYGAYLRFLGDIAMTDVWIVDENLNLLTEGMVSNVQYSYADLPLDAESVVKEVFQGKTTWSEGFSDLLKTPTLTIGTPIRSGTVVVGALLLHSPVAGVNEGIFSGFEILVVSIVIALSLSILLSILFAVSFTKPLKKMKNTALLLAGGEYSAKTGVLQKDEIGELAATIDVLSDRLDIASQESEQLAKLRRDFVANISHELRTPVTVIRGSLEALCDGVVSNPEQVAAYHHQMLTESIFLQRLVNDLLDLSRLQNTDFVMEMQEISLCDVLDDAIRSSKQIAMKKNIEILLETTQESEVSCSIIGDYGRLRQMFLIILDNAIKFSPQGSTVTVSKGKKRVSVKDQGIGIDKADLPYIFERFYKTESNENKNGTGLGLSIAKQISERHGMHLTVESHLDEGSKFTFDF